MYTVSVEIYDGLGGTRGLVGVPMYEGQVHTIERRNCRRRRWCKATDLGMCIGLA